ncbi:MAG: 2-C-methyl-D-erythritol 4-phosphate cytidylyltransferase [Gammaproteobacteria bacterium]|nr:2-C-methyl-D-erythritol 4-phosphate cytidylyltransferase [Gammaproteobacteria bacterium]
MKSVHRCWAIIPAAGIGSRIGSDVPKQYLKINGKAILEYAIEIFLRHHLIDGVVIVLAENDKAWKDLQINDTENLMTTIGGVERFHSVLNGLLVLEDKLNQDDWVLVHDAARPCLETSDLDNLINTISTHPTGGILAMSVRDTMKRSDADNHICETVDRDGLWHALTPQMFRYKKLRQAIESAIEKNIAITDEAQAIEHSGERPMLVEGSARNIKITRPEDLALASFYLSQMESTK